MQKHIKLAETFVELLENRFSVLGFRFGLDPLLGLLPVTGDVIAAIVALYLVWIGLQMKLPNEKVVQMVGNILLDMLLGFIPIVGDVADFAFKSSSKNLEILKSHKETTVS